MQHVRRRPLRGPRLPARLVLAAGEIPGAILELHAATPFAPLQDWSGAPPRFVLMEDGQVFVGGSRDLLSGRLEKDEVKSFEEQAESVRKMPGLASVVAFGEGEEPSFHLRGGKGKSPRRAGHRRSRQGRPRLAPPRRPPRQAPALRPSEPSALRSRIARPLRARRPAPRWLPDLDPRAHATRRRRRVRRSRRARLRPGGAGSTPRRSAWATRSTRSAFAPCFPASAPDGRSTILGGLDAGDPDPCYSPVPEETMTVSRRAGRP